MIKTYSNWDFCDNGDIYRFNQLKEKARDHMRYNHPYSFGGGAGFDRDFDVNGEKYLWGKDLDEYRRIKKRSESPHVSMRRNYW